MTNYFITQPWNNPSMLPAEIVNPMKLDLSIIEIESRVKRPSNRRSTSSKTGQATRDRWRKKIIAKYGAKCWLCLALGLIDDAIIDMDLRVPDPRAFTRDHVKPRSLGGRDSLANQRPAHKVCNESRGVLTVDQWIERGGRKI